MAFPQVPNPQFQNPPTNQPFHPPPPQREPNRWTPRFLICAAAIIASAVGFLSFGHGFEMLLPLVAFVCGLVCQALIGKRTMVIAILLIGLGAGLDLGMGIYFLATNGFGRGVAILVAFALSGIAIALLATDKSQVQTR